MYKKLKVELLSLCLLWIIFINPSILSTISQAENTEFSNTLTVTQDVYDKELWSDDQWIYYKLNVPKSSKVVVNLTYSGNLDLDLQFYIDEEHRDSQENLAWDITHCGFPSIVATRSSQIRGFNNTESAEYTNSGFDQARKVHILVFCYEGIGNSIYQIESNISMTAIPANELIQSSDISNAWIAFFVGLLVTTSVLFIITKKAKIPKKEQKEIKAEKEKKKAENMEMKKESKESKQDKKAKKKQVSMKARKTKSRR
ncbi:MAG: hypothetical protein GY870_20060 [archaeon]|nr:hypothetical protein [archaeon]